MSIPKCYKIYYIQKTKIITKETKERSLDYYYFYFLEFR